jgi:signal transduction histidine kinase
MNRQHSAPAKAHAVKRSMQTASEDDVIGVTGLLVGVGFLTALFINLVLLPGTHIISTLYLVPVLFACHRWRPSLVAGAATIATLLYVFTALLEQRPLTVWPFGVLALVIGGYLTVQFARQRQDIARFAQREAENRRRLQTFIGMVAHDLAGALTNVTIGTEMLGQLRRDAAPLEERVAIAAIDGGTRQMERLLGDLRDASTIGAGQFRVQPAAMDLVALVSDIVEQQQARFPRHRFSLDAPDRLPGMWDRDRLGQLVANLVSNACKYSPDGGEVRITVDPAPGAVTIGVRDHGIGIDEEYQALIFEPFARVQTRDDIPGTGLGLWIAKAIAEAHGGRIWVESTVGHGSAFFFTLPRTDATPEPRTRMQRTPNQERSVNPVPAPLPALPHVGLVTERKLVIAQAARRRVGR